MKHEETLQLLREVKKSYVLVNNKVMLPTHYFQWLLDKAEKSADYEETLNRIKISAAQVFKD